MAHEVQHIVSVSGGKDSAALYAMAVRMGSRLGKWRAVFCDTGNEHEATVEYVATLHEQIGGPKVEVIKADFTAALAHKREVIATKWVREGVPAETCERAIRLLAPTGNPFLDLCMWKGRFPSRRAQFCTEYTKRLPVQFQVVFPASKSGPVLQWIGVRRDESAARKDSPLFRRDDGQRVYRWHPIRHWSAAEVFAYLRESGVAPNPLYRQGMSRVGCMPCINCSKGELASVARRFPEHIERIAEWERIIAGVSKRGHGTFFVAKDDPLHAEDDDLSALTVHDAVAWSRTSRGGRQFDLETYAAGREPAPVCQSVYGLCE